VADMSRWQPDQWSRVGRVVYVGRKPDPNDETVRALSESGFTPEYVPLRGEGGIVASAVGQADVVVGSGPLPADVFPALRRTRLVLRPYVGYDDIDVVAATEQGILVANIPDTFVEEVANQTMAFILACNRKLLANDRYVRGGTWATDRLGRFAARPIHRISTQTLGLVGFGTIARLVAERARPFGLRMLAYDPYVAPDAAIRMGVALGSLETLLAESDIVSLHVFLAPETRGLISAERIRSMKPGAFLVNTSRGPVVDQPALIAALQESRIAGAALDVFETEPLPADSPLLTMDNVLLAPHVSSYSEEGDLLHRKRVAQIALQVARRGLPERKVVINKSLYDQLAAMPELGSVPRA